LRLPDFPEVSEDLRLVFIFESLSSSPLTEEPFLDGDFPAGELLLPLTTEGLLV